VGLGSLPPLFTLLVSHAAAHHKSSEMSTIAAWFVIAIPAQYRTGPRCS
jgi:hypothetical protein